MSESDELLKLKGQPYTKENAKKLIYGGIIDSKGIIIEVLTSKKQDTEITIPLEFAKNIHTVLENHASMGIAIVSKNIKELVSEEAYGELMRIFYKYHNANYGPFNRALKKLIDEKISQTEVRGK
jgi:hypothetical protein